MIIFINATAANSGGGLSILRQLLEFIKDNNLVGDKFWVFIPAGLTFEPIEDVVFVVIDTRSFLKRMIWDYRGMRRWSSSHFVYPDRIVSMQNTAVRFNDVKQVIYFHQSLSLVHYNWNPFEKGKLTLFLYKNIYPWFVKHSIRSHHEIVVQKPWIKKAFEKKFSHPEDHVFVCTPNISRIDVEQVSVMEFKKKDYFRFFYPANDMPYKNHTEIVRAVKVLQERGSDSKFQILFTCNKNSHVPFVKFIKDNNLDCFFDFCGQIDYQDVLSSYKSCNALLFPSYIETIGLPLLEAAQFGMPILCNDLEYSREVIGQYSGVFFQQLNSPVQWADRMEQVMKNKFHYSPYFNENNNDWIRFVEIIHS